MLVPVGSEKSAENANCQKPKELYTPMNESLSIYLIELLPATYRTISQSNITKSSVVEMTQPNFISARCPSGDLALWAKNQ